MAVPLGFIPSWLLVSFLLLAAGFGIGLLVARVLPGFKKAVDPVGETQEFARKLFRQNRVTEAVSYLVTRGETRMAAQLLTESGKHDRAVELLVEQGDFVAAGKAALAGKDVEKAISLLRRGRDFVGAARLLEKEGRVGEALECYRQAGDHERVANLARYEIDDPRMLMDAADHLIQSGHKALALPLLKKAKQSLREADILVELGRLGEAVAIYEEHGHLEQAARIYSRQGEHHRAAYLLIKAGQTAKALDELLLGGQPLSVARMLRKMGQLDKAVEILDHVDSEAFDFQEARKLASAILSEQGKHREAAVRLEQILQVTGFVVDSLEIVARLVDHLLNCGEVEATVRVLQEAVAAGLKDTGLQEQLRLLTQAPTLEPTPTPEPGPEQVAGKPALPARQTTPIGFPKSERYLLRSKLTRGGHGVLFLVHDVKSDVDVVLKLLHSESLPSEVARHYFLREARTAASLNHPNIVKIHDSGEVKGQLFIAMEYVKGVDLLTLLDPPRPKLPLKQGRDICLQLCAALVHAHDRKVIHRDVKMENVMLTDQGQVKLLDFGLAKALDEDPERSLFIVGTPNYMSPEQVQGRFLDHRTDIYSLGVLMYRLFTRRLPYEQKDLISASRFEPPPDPRKFDPTIPACLAEIILKCMEREPANRFQSVRDVAAALQGCLTNSA
jgi:tetratricopeptide (TPR) repeat protein